MKLSWLYALLLALNLAGFPAVAAITLMLGMPSTEVSIATRALIAALGATLFVLALFRRHTTAMKGWHWLALAIFWLAYIARLWQATVTDAHLLSRPAEDYWIWAMGACLIPMLGLLSQPNERAWGQAFRWSLVLLAIAGVVVVVYGGTTVDPDAGLAYDTGRLRLESLNPITVGHLGVSLLVLCVWALVSLGSRLVWWQRATLLAGTGLGLYLVTAAASRGPIIALVIVAVFFLLSLNLKRAWKPVALFSVLFALGYSVAVHLEESGQSTTLSRLMDAVSGQDISVGLRQQALSGAVDQFLGSPLVGDALEESTTRFYPHNVIVEALMATGLAGGIAFVLLLASAVRYAYRLVRNRSGHAWVALVFVQYLVAAQFSGSIYSSTILWSFLGATISLYLASNKAWSRSPTMPATEPSATTGRPQWRS